MRALVFPAGEPLSNAGAYGPDERHIVRYTFSGAAARGLLASAPQIEQLLDRAEQTLSNYIPVNRGERVAFVGKTMSVGLCAYAFDHSSFAARLQAELSRIEGLELTGDYLEGASIEGCFRASLAAAGRVAATNVGEPELNAAAVPKFMRTMRSAVAAAPGGLHSRSGVQPS